MDGPAELQKLLRSIENVADRMRAEYEALEQPDAPNEVFCRHLINAGREIYA